MILSGQYEMGVGYGEGQKTPPILASMVLTKGSRYAMVNEDGWHYVKPIDQPSLSVMVTGVPWKRWSPKPKSHAILRPLTEMAQGELLATFANAMVGL